MIIIFDIILSMKNRLDSLDVLRGFDMFFITGGAGFIGSAVARHIINATLELFVFLPQLFILVRNTVFKLFYATSKSFQMLW